MASLETLIVQIPPAPNLSVAPAQYSPEYINQLNNILRLYFNRMSGALQILAGTDGGRFLQMPSGGFHYDGSTALTAAINNTVTTIPVTSTLGFNPTGSILIDYEVISYTGITATSFTGCTRGAYGTSAASHTNGTGVAGAQGAAANTVTLMQMNTIDYKNGLVLTSSSGMTVAYTGVYNIQFSAQTCNAGNTPDNFTIWLRVNNIDVPFTASIATTPAVHAGVPGAGIVSANFFLTLNAQDTVQFYWTTDNGTTVVVTYPAGTSPVHPASPGFVATVSYVSSPL